MSTTTINGKVSTKTSAKGETKVTVLEVAPNTFSLKRLDYKAESSSLDALEINTERETAMLAAAHEAYIAQEIRGALAKNADAGIQELTRYAADSFSSMVEEVNANETAGSYGKYGRMVERFNEQSLTAGGMYMLETGRIHKDQVQADMRRSIEPPPAPPTPKPPPEKRKWWQF